MIRLIESNAKCRHLKKFTCIGTLRQVFICLRHPTLLGYCLGWSSNFVGVQLLQNMAQQDSTPPPPTLSQPLTVCTNVHVYTVLWHREEGGRWTRETVRGAKVHKAGSKIPTWLTVSQSKKINTCSKVPLEVNFFRWRHFVLVLWRTHSDYSIVVVCM